MSDGAELPARHPDFEPGHTLSLKHGAYSERVIAERAEQVHHELLIHAPWLAEDRYMPAVAAYLRAVSREQLAHEALLSGTGKSTARLIEAATAAGRLAWNLGDELGLTPAGHAKLKSVMVDAIHAEASLEDLAVQGAEIRARRKAELAADAEAKARAEAVEVAAPDMDGDQ